MSMLPREVDYEDGLRLVPKLLAKGRLETAEQWADRLCDYRPDDPRAHNQAGLVRQRRREPSAATLHFRRAAALRPDAGEVWANLGNAARRAADPQRALRCHQVAACCRPDLPEVRVALAFSLLSVGDYRRGFAEHEHRLDRAKLLEKYSGPEAPVWDRRSPKGRRLLVMTEQGAGDTVQFLRFIGPLAEQGAEVTIACPPGLERLVRSAPGVAGTAPRGSVGYDGLELLMSLPAYLGTDRASLPVPTRYLEPPSPKLRLPDTGRLRVGLCWSGSPAHPKNEPRRIPFDALAPVLSVPDIDFYCLQFLTGLKAASKEARLADLAPYVYDFADTAAMVDQMDLVITIDTSVAHIAGALGKPVWTMLARVADWRWGIEDETSCWYPSMRLFRQARQGAWDKVVDRVVAELREIVSRRPILPPQR